LVTAEYPVKIELPRIAAPLPDVWGKDDSLLIVFTVDGRHPLTHYSLDIKLGPHSTVRASFGQERRVSKEHTYEQIGQYEIKAVLVKDTRNGYVSGSRMVRIVDYREEIVRVYNETVATLRSQGMSVSHRMTAREVGRSLQVTMPSLPRETIDSLISVFEHANYSTHPVARPAYERMYLAVVEMEKHAPGEFEVQYRAKDIRLTPDGLAEERHRR
jgi:hypothetical protein